MKKYYLIFLCLFLVANIMSRPRVYLSYATYFSPEDGTYIETNIAITSKSVVFVKNENNKYQANVEVILKFKQKDSIKSSLTFFIKSPQVDDTTNIFFPFFLDVKRIVIPNGNYDFEISIRDINKDDKPLEYTEKMSVNIDTIKVSISGIQLIDKYEKSNSDKAITKYGYDFYPYISNFYPEQNNKLLFLFEVYNTNKILGDSSNYNINYYIEDIDSKKIMAGFNNKIQNKSSLIDIKILDFDISSLPSGNYYLNIEIKDTNNKIITFNNIFFQRSNKNLKIDKSKLYELDLTNTFAEKINNYDTLLQYINYLSPISTHTELLFIEYSNKEHKSNRDSLKYKSYKENKVRIFQHFFYDFWYSRSETDPSNSWKNYKKEVDIVNKLYGAPKIKGYLTDRGRVRLKYGEASSINSVKSSADELPYEIWHYYNLSKQGDKKFIFYLRQGGTNNYELLHSDAFGEIKQPDWQHKLKYRKGNHPDPDFYDTYDDVWGSKSNDVWKFPR